MTGGWAATNTLRGRHSIGCPAGRGARNLPGPCECGHDAALAVMEAALAAAGFRLGYGHNDTCGSVFGDAENPYPCSCGHDALEAALRAVREGK